MITAAMDFIAGISISALPTYIPDGHPETVNERFLKTPSAAIRHKIWQPHLFTKWLKNNRDKRDKYRIWKEDEDIKDENDEAMKYNEEILDHKMGASYKSDEIWRKEIAKEYNLSKEDLSKTDEDYETLTNRHRDIISQRIWGDISYDQIDDEKMSKVIEDIFFEFKLRVYTKFVVEAPQQHWEALVANAFQMHSMLVLYGRVHAENKEYFEEFKKGLSPSQCQTEELLDPEEPTPESFGIFEPRRDDEGYMDEELYEEYEGIV